MTFKHTPVMLQEAVEFLNCRPGKTYVDCNLGGAGHARAIIKQILPGGTLIGIDQDIEAVRHADSLLADHANTVRIIHSNFVHLADILKQCGISAADGILFDLGISLHQIENSGRGFSFNRDEPLDMRMDINGRVTAGDIINTASEQKLSRIIKAYGEEPHARRIAKRIVDARRSGPIRTTRELAEIANKAVKRKKFAKKKIHPATRLFMAIRIAVNQELENLEQALKDTTQLLSPGGRLCVISFHSLEDRIVKHHMRQAELGCTCPPDFPQCACGKKPQMKRLTSKPVTPSEGEVAKNPMARSAKLRAAEKI